VIFYNTYDFYNSRVYKIENHDSSDFEKAYKIAKEWDYIKIDTKIPIGVIYENTNKKTYEDRI
jgi:2-oxoglutarate ferredoxin oxidoreductase subunit beta